MPSAALGDLERGTAVEGPHYGFTHRATHASVSRCDPLLAAHDACAFSQPWPARRTRGRPGRRQVGPQRLAGPLRYAAGAQGEQCALIQSVTAEDRANVGLTVIVLKTADQKSRLMRVVAPLGRAAAVGPGAQDRQADVGRAGFVRCLPNGCVAEVVMDDNLVKQLRTGQTATFIIFQTPEEGIGFPMSLKGFGEGFDKLP